MPWATAGQLQPDGCREFAIEYYRLCWCRPRQCASRVVNNTV